MKSILCAGLIAASTLMAPVSQAIAAPVGTVSCRSMSGETRQSPIAFSAITPANDRNYSWVIVDDIGIHILVLNQALQVISAGTVEGQTISPWNLVAYDSKPLTLDRNGTFSLDMMVSTRSSCQFQGTTVFLQGAETPLFSN
ncbi:hypothetical protein [Leptolyngbya ohadii]|uniref:hypothetical protein n=1 Tax=Leptolyngbya ohadii TaxID=1962290 RepID=UPI00117BBABB|nr:hypothetical protein [Leptolyngbya ohadii]